MAYTTNTTNVSSGYGSAHGLREHLMDWVSIVSPTDVPLTRMLDRVSVGNPYFEWQLDDVATPTTAAILAESAELDDFPDDTITSRLRAKNRSCIVGRSVDLSDRMRQINYAGVSDEFAYQLMKQSLACAKQNEFNLHWDANTAALTTHTLGLVPWTLMAGGLAASTSNGAAANTITGVNWTTSGTAFQSSILYSPVAAVTGISLASPAVITTTQEHGLTNGDQVVLSQGTLTGVNFTAGGFDTVGTVASCPSDTTFTITGFNADAASTGGAGVLRQNDFTRANLNTVLSTAWNKGMNVDGCVALSGAGMKRIISQFALVYSGSGATQSMNLLNNRNAAAADKIITDTIDVYDSDFGKIFFNLDRYMNTGALSSSSVSGLLTYDQGATDSHARKSLCVHPQASMLFIEPSMVQIGTIQDLAYTPLAKVGLSTKGAVSVDNGLIVKNPVCLAGIFGYRTL